ncbi:hypothetical protein [Paenibacillus dendritiformis]|uniref:Peptidase S1 domain-containing protein n=1 Tax=Paenibacillus dendritiformis C454 TaxID=1131935 RepID=H3SHH2_9BACL|nr:hypothetical protein [Paenibacillus dendritiformis]EHQ61508.1 hypothetical protein PDENDC454_14927 [Paenibacillus dendritiformis C454]CAH8772434.1 S1 family peptidase [Paenibacillus dendritiformis]
MKLRKLVSLIFLASFLLFSSIISAAEDTADKYGWITINGSISDIAEITQQNNLNKIPYPLEMIVYPDNLTDKLFLENYVEKQRIRQDFPAIKKLIENEPSQYSGHYYNADKGTVIIQITENLESLKEQVRDSVKNYDKVQFEVKKYSWAEIENAKETIINNVEPGTVRALIPDIKNNKLIIAFDEDALVNEETVSSLISQPDMLEFTTMPASALIAETDDTSYGSPFPIGSKIGGDYVKKNENEYEYYICTAGYFGVDQNDQEVLVTAGHCQNKARINTEWYQPTWKTPTIGKFTFRTTSAVDGTNKTSDAGYITLHSSYSGRPRVPYPSSSNMAMITGVYTSDTPGDTIYFRGANSGTTTSGKISYSNVDIYWGKGGYGYKRAEVLATGYSSIGGDSGGPILTNYAYDNDLTGWTFDLAGTHTGVITLKSTESPIPPGTYKVYEPVWTTFNDLNLTGIKVIAKP